MSHNDATDHPYEPPEIVALGSYADLTSGGGVTTPDASGASAP